MSGDPLEARAHAARERAHAPYSGYRVGAALETGDGRIFEGCNVENASYSVTCCAERVALYTAVAAGVRDFRRLVVSASGRTPYPCGACRQALSEFAADGLAITVVGDGGERHEFTLGELLPKPFRMETGRS
ncbi:MAG TPA: cytidine deaminase [Gemmatimonadota bacterium]|nr:cytidine deaminase [Gemmatimonadota bacterium]